MLKNKSKLFFLFIVFNTALFSFSCTSDNEVYDKELSLDISDGRGSILYQWIFKYPASLKYDKDIDNAVFVDGAILKMLANAPDGWGYGCYCAFKTLIQPDLLVNDREDYVQASAIMLRRLESECFPEWLRNFWVQVDKEFKPEELGAKSERDIVWLQETVARYIFANSGYSLDNWLVEQPMEINGINVYVYTYKTKKNGLDTKHKVACLIKDKLTCELSLRANPKEYKNLEPKFDKILSTVTLNKMQQTDE